MAWFMFSGRSICLPEECYQAVKKNLELNQPFV
jgi:hypothetical protein